MKRENERRRREVGRQSRKKEGKKEGREGERRMGTEGESEEEKDVTLINQS